MSRRIALIIQKTNELERSLAAYTGFLHGGLAQKGQQEYQRCMNYLEEQKKMIASLNQFRDDLRQKETKVCRLESEITNLKQIIDSFTTDIEIEIDESQKGSPKEIDDQECELHQANESMLSIKQDND